MGYAIKKAMCYATCTPLWHTEALSETALQLAPGSDVHSCRLMTLFCCYHLAIRMPKRPPAACV